MSHSSTKAEYRSIASTTAEIILITFLLHDIGISFAQPPQLFCDNLSALYMSINPIFQARSKHIELDYHFVQEKVAVGHLITRRIPSSSQLADIFTNPLPKATFQVLRMLRMQLKKNPTKKIKRKIFRRMKLQRKHPSHHKSYRRMISVEYFPLIQTRSQL